LGKAFLAAPFVATAAFAAQACSQPTYTNPEAPQNPPEPTATFEPPMNPPMPTETAPTATVAVPPTAEPTGELPDPPPGPGNVVKEADGTCSFHFPPPESHCPPHASCNPGPPRMPMKVKCPPDKL